MSETVGGFTKCNKCGRGVPFGEFCQPCHEKAVDVLHVAMQNPKDKTIAAQSEHISKQGATIAEQAKRIDELEKKICDALWDVGEKGWKRRAETAEADRDKLREALRKYGCCRSDCEGLPYCTCGYEDIRVEFALGDNGEER